MRVSAGGRASPVGQVSSPVPDGREASVCEGRNRGTMEYNHVLMSDEWTHAPTHKHGDGKMKVKDSNRISRRGFLGASAAAVTTFNIIPRHVLGAPGKPSPNDKLNIGHIGTGGRAGAHFGAAGKHNVAALCDVDKRRYGGVAKKFPSAKTYQDWRVMLEKNKNLDAVFIATPDHTHAIAAVSAMQLGMHVYVEKPLTRTVYESRLMAEAAAKYKVCTQMGNQGHATTGARLTNEWIQSGALGEVSEVHCSSDRPRGMWAQDMVRPPTQQVPADLNWDVWLGTAPEEGYNSSIHPFKWRGYFEYGAGALGDFGAHVMDHPWWALGLDAPKSAMLVKSDRKTPGSEKVSYPRGLELHYEFAAKGKRGPVTIKWFSGSVKCPHPEVLESNRKTHGNGCVYYGSKNVMMHGSHGGTPRIIPELKMKEFKVPPRTIPDSQGGHHGEWFKAIKENDPSIAMSNFAYAGPLSEAIAFGCAVIRAGVIGEKISWNGKEMKSSNDIVNRYINPACRKGWELPKV